jgi:RNA polymerase sigma-70 factor (ECF subfamily)
LAAGEDTAFDQLIARWQGPVRRFALRFVQNEADAEDLAQETFVHVYRHRLRYRPQCRFSTWLFTIAINLCRSHPAKAARRKVVPIDGSAPSDGPPGSSVAEIADPGPEPGASAILAERAAAVREAVRELPGDLRAAVLLFEYEDLSHAEIAEITGTTPKAVETRLYRVRGFLRERLRGLL